MSPAEAVLAKKVSSLEVETIATIVSVRKVQLVQPALPPPESTGLTQLEAKLVTKILSLQNYKYRRPSVFRISLVYLSPKDVEMDQNVHISP